jgi:hypothetical protein
MLRIALLPALALAGLAAAETVEDVLYSSRLMKRGIDAEGNFNMCKSHLTDNAAPVNRADPLRAQHSST